MKKVRWSWLETNRTSECSKDIEAINLSSTLDSVHQQQSNLAREDKNKLVSQRRISIIIIIKIRDAGHHHEDPTFVHNTIPGSHKDVSQYRISFTVDVQVRPRTSLSGRRHRVSLKMSPKLRGRGAVS